MNEQLELQIDAGVPLPAVGTIRRADPLAMDAEGKNTRRGTAVSYDLLQQLRELLLQLTPAARVKFAAVALALATNMPERLGMHTVERINHLRRVDGEPDRMLQVRLNPLRKRGQS